MRSNGTGYQSEVEVFWVTRSYKAIIIVAMLFAVESSLLVFVRFQDVMQDRLASWTYRSPSSLVQLQPALVPSRLVSAEGEVRLKKTSSSQWLEATTPMLLNNGDVLQTGPQGAADIVFGDGSLLSLISETLVVMEAAAANGTATQPVLRLNSGSATLRTSSAGEGSALDAILADATLTVGPHSEVWLRSTPRAQLYELLLTQGTATISRAGESLALNEADKIIFRGGASPMVRSTAVPSPVLVGPTPDQPLNRTLVVLSWTCVEQARGYRVQVASNPYLHRPLVERRVRSRELKLHNLASGQYYWRVEAIDENGTGSFSAPVGRFRLERPASLEASPGM